MFCHDLPQICFIWFNFLSELISFRADLFSNVCISSYFTRQVFQIDFSYLLFTCHRQSHIVIVKLSNLKLCFQFLLLKFFLSFLIFFFRNCKYQIECRNNSYPELGKSGFSPVNPEVQTKFTVMASWCITVHNSDQHV